MSASASWAIQRGIYQALVNSTDVTTLLGGARIYDDPPQAANLPFVSLGQSRAPRLEHRHRGRRRASADLACLVARRRQEAGA